jgi:hypothetical protein
MLPEMCVVWGRQPSFFIVVAPTPELIDASVLRIETAGLARSHEGKLEGGKKEREVST